MRRNRRSYLLSFRNAFFGLIFFAGLTRLTLLGNPNEVVFDEFHFGKFVNAYCCTHERFFDIHPPAAKLPIAGLVALSQVGKDALPAFDRIGGSYAGISPWWYRIYPAVVGIAIVVIVYFLALLLSADPTVSMVTAMVIALDNAMILQSRVISLDGHVMFFELLAVYAACRGWGVVTGVAAGLAFGGKLTGLACVPVSLIILFWRWGIARAAASIFVAAGVYLSAWWLHFHLLYLPGSGDLMYLPKGHFWLDFWNMHYVMLEKNVNLSGGHSYASSWWTWPLSLRGIYYWVSGERQIYLLPNVPVWWWAHLMAVLALFRPWSPKALIPAVCYVATFFPYAGVKRVLFIYHYLPPYTFLVLFVAMQWQDFFRARWKILMMLIFAGYLVMFPLTYGLVAWRESIFAVFPGWR